MGLWKKKENKQQVEDTIKKPSLEPAPEHLRQAGGSMVTRSVLEQQTRIRWVFREERVNQVDNGWRVFGELDDQDYINVASNHVIVDFNTLIDILPSLINIYEMPVGTELMVNYDACGAHIINTLTNQEVLERVKSEIQLAFAHNLSFISQLHEDPMQLVGFFQNKERLTLFQAGKVDVPSGKIIVGDPLCYLQQEHTLCLAQEIACGSYLVELAILNSKLAGIRIAGARCKFTELEAVRYEVANLQGNVKLNGFPVDAGMACFCDQETVKEYHQFLAKWYEQHPKGNLYNDYFAQLFAQSYQQYPDLQRPGGDFLDWIIPETQHHIILFASGLGDGYYQSFWGYANSGECCELMIAFMDVKVW